MAVDTGSCHEPGEQEIRRVTAHRIAGQFDIAQETRTIRVNQWMVGRPTGSIQFNRGSLHAIEVIENFFTMPPPISAPSTRRRNDLPRLDPSADVTSCIGQLTLALLSPPAAYRLGRLFF